MCGIVGIYLKTKKFEKNLEAEDLCALTVESAAMARVPLAGTSWIPGLKDKK